MRIQFNRKKIAWNITNIWASFCDVRNPTPKYTCPGHINNRVAQNVWPEHSGWSHRHTGQKNPAALICPWAGKFSAQPKPVWRYSIINIPCTCLAPTFFSYFFYSFSTGEWINSILLGLHSVVTQTLVGLSIARKPSIVVLREINNTKVSRISCLVYVCLRVFWGWYCSFIYCKGPHKIQAGTMLGTYYSFLLL